MNESGQMDVLLVEDNPDDAEITLHTLRKHGLGNRIEWAKDGAEALHYVYGNGQPADLHTPRLILLDLQLPRVNGIEVLERLKSDPRTRPIPVVVLTSSTQEEDLRRCYELGVNSYVGKPVQFDVFAAKVTQLGLYWLLVNHPPPAPAP